jgi:hypothetical protein
MLWNLVSDPYGGTYVKNEWRRGTEDNIWIYESATNRELHNLFFSQNVIGRSIKKGEMGGPRSTRGRDENCTCNFSRKSCFEETTYKTYALMEG